MYKQINRKYELHTDKLNKARANRKNSRPLIVAKTRTCKNPPAIKGLKRHSMSFHYFFPRRGQRALLKQTTHKTPT